MDGINSTHGTETETGEEVEVEEHVNPAEIDEAYGGGFVYVVTLKSGAREQFKDRRPIDAVLEDFRASFLAKTRVYFSGTADGTKDGAGVVDPIEVATLRYFGDQDIAAEAGSREVKIVGLAEFIQFVTIFADKSGLTAALLSAAGAVPPKGTAVSPPKHEEPTQTLSSGIKI